MFYCRVENTESWTRSMVLSKHVHRYQNILQFLLSQEWKKCGNDSQRAGLGRNTQSFVASAMQILFFEIYTRGHFTVQGIRHSINTVPTMVLGEAFRIVIRHPPPFPLSLIERVSTIYHMRKHLLCYFIVAQNCEWLMTRPYNTHISGLPGH